MTLALVLGIANYVRFLNSETRYVKKKRRWVPEALSGNIEVKID